ncbi:MAG: putative Transposon Ty3-I Gag-Pol polyprotein [Streblomastix strix]|uniref:Putative Transposon Ty3-I Gag-Pol polyprotein n=1 Tax=Streblomastix strix TaxID=222440 RepID=A0A5J4X6U4_9EUKA|nr:MAG: putative Transposon Ty3-I Gag-Pol polyprotein [Streblomastix strix]
MSHPLYQYNQPTTDIKPQFIPIKAIPQQQDSKTLTSFHTLQTIPSTQQNNSSEVFYRSPPYNLIDMKFPIGGRLKQFRNAWQQLGAWEIVNVGIQAKMNIIRQFRVSREEQKNSRLNKCFELRKIAGKAAEIVRLDDQDKYRKCISSCNCEQQPQELYGLQNQGQDIQIHRDTIWLKHAPFVLNKTMRPVMKNFREILGIRCLAYCDDLIFLSQSKDQLQLQVPQIVNKLGSLGWGISEDKSLLIPTQKVEFFSWVINSSEDQISMTIQRRTEMITILSKWRKISQLQYPMKIKYLASMIGKINFFKLQFKRGGVHMRILNQMKSNSAQTYRWKGYLRMGRKVLPEIFWWINQVRIIKPIRATILPVEAILRTDASEDGWGTELEILNSKMKIKESEKWTKENCLRIETDNKVAAFNIRRGAAAIALVKLTDRILQEAESLEIQLTSLHVPGKENQVAYSLSRLEIIGNYMINSAVLSEALELLLIQSSIDVFANRNNRQCRRSLNKLDNEGGIAVFIHPRWTAQAWWTDLQRTMIQNVVIGPCQEFLEAGGRMRMKRRHLPPGQLQISVLEGRKAKYSSNKFQKKEDQMKQILKEQQIHGTVSGEDTAKDMDQNASSANIIESVNAISVLFKAEGHHDTKINGKMLKLTMKKPKVKVKQPIKETTCYSINILLIFIEQQALVIELLSEEQFLGCTFTSIMAFCTLRMVEVLRANVTENDDGSWNLNTECGKEMNLEQKLYLDNQTMKLSVQHFGQNIDQIALKDLKTSNQYGIQSKLVDKRLKNQLQKSFTWQ